jgi:hypothetical protein
MLIWRSVWISYRMDYVDYWFYVGFVVIFIRYLFYEIGGCVGSCSSYLDIA